MISNILITANDIETDFIQGLVLGCVLAAVISFLLLFTSQNSKGNLPEISVTDSFINIDIISN